MSLAAHAAISTEEPRFLAILSEERSSSTNLASQLASSLACAASVSEPILDRASAGGYERWAWLRRTLRPSLIKERRQRLLEYVSAMHGHVCSVLRREKPDCGPNGLLPAVRRRGI